MKYIKKNINKSLSEKNLINLLHYIFKKKRKKEKLLKSKKIVLYGMGSLGSDAIDYLKFLKIKPDLLVDNVRTKFGKKNIFKPGQVNENIKRESLLLVCIVNLPFIKILNELKKKGWKNICHFYDFSQSIKKKHPLNNGWEIEDININDQKKIQFIATRFWSDTFSKKYYLQFLAWKKLKQEWHFKNAPIKSEDRFFIDKIIKKIKLNEVFVDIGAHTCAVSKKLIKITKNKIRELIIIEPDKNNFTLINKFIETKKLKDKVKFLKVVISNRSKKQKFFEGLRYSSQLSNYGNKIVKTTTLDNLKLKPTFIKIHIEGNELNALKGSIKTINKYRPKIAFTAYHDDQIVWRIPLWLFKNLKEYKFYFRLHSWCGSGAVVYCIPKNN